MPRNAPTHPARSNPEQPGRIVAVSPDDGSAIDLRNPLVAAALSWAVPGLGQIYQGRTFKGSLFMAAILTTFVCGLWLGGGRVVYAALPSAADGAEGRGVRAIFKRAPFLCQACAGVVAMPAVLQAARLSGPSREPWLLNGFMAPPLAPGQYVSRRYAESLARRDSGIGPDDFFDKPPFKQFRRDQLAMWHRQLGKFFEIGSLYTMLAGMLNLLVIYDAWAGPLGTGDESRKGRGGAGLPAADPRSPAS